MSKYTPDEVSNAARLLDGLSRKMLNDYAATLRQQAERTCSDERPCINCYADHGECLGPSPETLRQRSEVDGCDWLHLRDGVVVGTSRPDYENGRYVRIGKLPSEGGIYARPEQAPEIFPGTSEQINNLSIKGESR